MYMLQTYFFVYLVKIILNASDLAVPKYFFKEFSKNDMLYDMILF